MTRICEDVFSLESIIASKYPQQILAVHRLHLQDNSLTSLLGTQFAYSTTLVCVWSGFPFRAVYECSPNRHSSWLNPQDSNLDMTS